MPTKTSVLAKSCDDSSILLRSPKPEDWPQIAELFAKSIPNALASSLGRPFGVCYYRHMAEAPGSVSIAAFDQAGTLAGVVIGTLDRQRVLRPPFTLKLQLVIAAHFRLFSPAFLRWLADSRHTSKREDSPLQAELLMIAIDPRFRSLHLATRLLDELEMYFRNHGLHEPYIIHTEKNNHAANTFYQQVGAHFAGTRLHHNKQINEWHKVAGRP
ncbi:MAG: GNAT family N-acetyltransferase [Desulfuromonadales bacterium]|nr:GNAT family N-acetyltransferase [Desulfuromonadales bacterium]